MFKDNVYLEVLVSNKKKTSTLYFDLKLFHLNFLVIRSKNFANTNCVKSSLDMNVAYITKIFKKCGTYRLS